MNILTGNTRVLPFTDKCSMFLKKQESGCIFTSIFRATSLKGGKVSSTQKAQSGKIEKSQGCFQTDEEVVKVLFILLGHRVI